MSSGKKTKKIRWGLGLALLVVFLGWQSQTVAATEPGPGNEENSLSEELLENLDFGEIDSYLQNDGAMEMSFAELVKSLMTGGSSGGSGTIITYLKNLVFKEISANKRLLVVIVALAGAFALIKNFSSIFKNAYISELAFILLYIELMILLMKSFLIMYELLGGTLGRVIDFMKVLLPVFCVSLVFSNGAGSAAGFYQIAFLVIFIIQSVILYLLAPLVQIYVAMEFLNHILEGEKFTRMCELLEDGIRWGIKIIITIVMGLNVVQGLINPAVDRFKTTSWSKAISMIPGIGNSANALSQMLIGTGMVVKNSVGVAAMLVIVMLGLVPMIKIYVMAFLYKLASAILEPITDKRIAGSVNGVFKGSVLAGKLMLTSLFLFFVTIAIITATTSFTAG